MNMKKFSQLRCIYIGQDYRYPAATEFDNVMLMKCPSFMVYPLFKKLPPLKSEKPSAAVEFKGKNSYACMPPINKDVSNFTVSLWIKMRAHNPVDYSYCLDFIGEQGTTASRNLGLYIAKKTSDSNPEAIGWSAKLSDGTNISEVIPEKNIQGRWLHIVLTRQKSAYRLYLNGSLKRETPNNSDATISLNSPWRLGMVTGHNDTEDRFWYNGLMDGIAIWDRALKEEEIQSIYSFSFGQGDKRNLLKNHSSNLIGYWHAKGNALPTLIDHSGHKLHGTIENIAICNVYSNPERG